jgi:hypothetical protein
MERSDGLNSAFTAVGDVPEGQKIDEERRRRILSVLVDEGDRVGEEAGRYKDKLGLKN